MPPMSKGRSNSRLVQVFKTWSSRLKCVVGLQQGFMQCSWLMGFIAVALFKTGTVPWGEELRMRNDDAHIHMHVCTYIYIYMIYGLNS